MTQYLNPLSGDQHIDLNGDPYDGAKLFCYAANTTTKVTLTKDQAGLSNHTNPIILNSRGEPADGVGVTYPMWQSGGQTVDLVLAPSDDTDPPVAAIKTYEDLAGVNDATLTIDQWIAGPTPTFITTTTFSLVGDQTSDFHVGRRLKLLDSGGTDYGVITVSAFTSLTTITVVLDSGVLDSGLSSVSYGLLTAVDHSIPTGADLNWTGDMTFSGNVNLGADVDLAGVEGNDGQIPVVNVGSSAMVWWAPAGHINGLVISNNVTDSANDIDIATGEATDSGAAYVMKLTSGLTKQIDFTWAAGTDAGGLFSGSVAADTWYHVFLIRKDSDGSLDAGFDTSVTAANIPAGYTAYRLIDSVLTDISSNIIAFSNRECGHAIEKLWLDPPLDINVGNAGTAAVLRTLSVPPSYQTTAILNVYVSQVASGTYDFYMSPTDVNDEQASPTTAPLAMAIAETNKTEENGITINIRTDSNQQIRTRQSGSDGNSALRIVTLGFIIDR